MPANKHVTRRQAVQAAGAVTAAAVVSKVQAAPAVLTAKAAGNQLRYGIIGVGSRGAFLQKRLKSVDNGYCQALCDIYQPNLEAALAAASTKPRGYQDYRELLAARDIDAVIVATPLYRHFDVTRDALLAGKHVFCEKSLVFKPEEIHALRALAGEHPKQVLQTGLQRRYSPYYRAAKALIDKGLLGDVTHIRAQWHRNGSGRRPVADSRLERQINWRFYREYSGGLTAELASHQIDVADWFFNSTPEAVMGMGGIDHWKDGRDTYDNIQLLFRYPKGRKLSYSSISTNQHLPMFDGGRPEFGEVIMGTAGTIHITIGDAANPAVGPALGMWFREPKAPVIKKDDKSKQNWVAGATVSSTSTVSRGLPILLPGDFIGEADSFLKREMKFARQWLYKKGVMMPEEERNPVEISLESFFRCAMEGKRPPADVEVGLADSTAVILSNLAMDEERKVYFREIETMGVAG